VLGVAALVVLALVAGIMAIGNLGPFGSGHKALAGTRPTAGSGLGTGPGPDASPVASLTGPSTSPGHPAKKPNSKKPGPSKSGSLPPVTPSPSSSKPKGSGGGGSGGGGGSTPYGPDLVTDGTFSDPTLGAWNYGVYQATLDPGGGISGQNAVQLTANPTAGVAETIDGLKSGGRYVLTGYVQASTSPVYIGARDDASGKEVDVSAEAASWDKLSVDFTVPSGQTSAVVFCVQRRGGAGLCSDMAVHALR
jgi:hypothetical protein